MSEIKCLWLVLLQLGSVWCDGGQSFLQSSEDFLQDGGEGRIYPFHKPLQLYPLLMNPFNIKAGVFTGLKSLKPTVTMTKTLILQTVRQEKKNLVCVKARPGLPPCSPDGKEGSFILPTKVPEHPAAIQAQTLGYMVGSEVRSQEETEIRDEGKLSRQERFLVPLRHTEYVTKTLWVTRVEDYVDTQVTATLVPFNCVPCNQDLPPCPEKVEHYVHYEEHHGAKPIWETKTGEGGHHLDPRLQESRENSKVFDLQDKAGNKCPNSPTT